MTFLITYNRQPRQQLAGMIPKRYQHIKAVLNKEVMYGIDTALEGLHRRDNTSNNMK
jgi:hypothetical protein